MDKIILKGKLFKKEIGQGQAEIEVSPPSQEEISKLKEGDEVLLKVKVDRHMLNIYNTYGKKDNIIAILPPPQQSIYPCYENAKDNKLCRIHKPKQTFTDNDFIPPVIRCKCCGQPLDKILKDREERNPQQDKQLPTSASCSESVQVVSADTDISTAGIGTPKPQQEFCECIYSDIINEIKHCNACGKPLRPAKPENKELMDDIAGALARGYCTKENADKVLDPDLIKAMLDEVSEVLPKPEVCGISTKDNSRTYGCPHCGRPIRKTEPKPEIEELDLHLENENKALNASKIECLLYDIRDKINEIIRKRKSAF